MEALDGHVLLRVADATGDPLPTIARLASLSRAFARVSRDELWPLYCLSRAAHADEGEAAAVVARLVREAGSADAPRNAASSLARCVSACPGMAHACCAALREDAARPPQVPQVEGGSATGAEAAHGRADGVGESAVGGGFEFGERLGGVGGSEGVEEGTRAECERVDRGREEGRRSDAAGGVESSSASGSERDAARDAPTDSTHTNSALPAAPAVSPPPVAPHLDDLCSLCSDLAPQIFLPECFLPAPRSPPSPAPRLTPPRTTLPTATTSSPPLPPCSSAREEQTAGEVEEWVKRDEGAEEVTVGKVGNGEEGEGEVGEGEIREGEIREGEIREGEIREGEIREEEIREGVIREGEIREGEIREGEVGEGAAVVMRTRGFCWLLQGQPFAQGACPFCHGQVWNATALLQPAAHTVLGCAEGDVCCFICTQGHLFGLYKSRCFADLLDYMGDDGMDFDDMYEDYMDDHDMDDGVMEDDDGEYDAFEDALDDYREMIAEVFENEPDWF
ncbi:unnamed protein product [Closterium sp. NIES-53]